MSLRSRLVAGFLAIAALLIAADAAVALLVRHSLLQAVDRRLEVGRGFPRSIAGTTTTTEPASPPDTTTPAPRPGFSDLYVVFVDPSGAVRQRNANTVGRHAEPPVLPTDLALRATATGSPAKPFSLAAEGGGYGYRAVAIHDPRGGFIVISVSLKDTIETVRKVIGVEGAATLLVLLALGVVAWWVLHHGVRPIDQMTLTAEAIAAGDLSRRVERAEPNTEAGRLGIALNTMMAEIEGAFRDQGASEDRLRRFVADASHELRTPLTSIRGYAELWRQGGLVTDEAITDAMRRLEQEAARMGVLVDEMLLLARLDQGRPLERAPVDLVGLVDDAAADARAVEPDRPISVDAPAHLWVTGDDARLRQVLANLVANARTHTPPGVAVRIRGAVDGATVMLDVEDDGPGLGPEPQRVFERFYRADPARARASGGIGLGLSIVSAVIEAHGGTATASASPSGGARIHIELPLAPDPAAVFA